MKKIKEWRGGGTMPGLTEEINEIINAFNEQADRIEKLEKFQERLDKRTSGDIVLGI